MVPPGFDADTRAGSPAGVTMGMLAAWSGSSPRSIKQWHHDDLLPAPTRKPDGRARGRAPYRFPTAAIPVAQRLGVFRKYVTGSENTKLWLFLEGFPHPSLTDALLEARLRDWHEALWRRTERRLQSGTRGGGAVSDEGTADDLLDALDRTVRQPLQARFSAPIAEAGASAVALMLGVADGIDAQAWCAAVQDDRPAGRRLVGFVEATLMLLGRISGMPWPGGLALTEADERFLASRLSLFLPRLRQFPERLDWERIRFSWRAICSITDPWLAAPTTAPDPWTVLACEWRRLCYRSAPECTLLTLSAIAEQQFGGALGPPLPIGAPRGLEGAIVRGDVAGGGVSMPVVVK